MFFAIKRFVDQYAYPEPLQSMVAIAIPHPLRGIRDVKKKTLGM
jgi:hypothetical protein